MAQLVDTDVLLVNRADVTYTMTFAELQQSVKDKLIGGLTLSGDPLPEFDDSDQFLVNRENVTYKISFAELIGSITLAFPPVLTNVSLVENNPGADARFTSQAFTASSTLSEDGIPQSEKTIDAYVEGRFAEKLRSTNTVTAVDTVTGEWFKGSINGSTADSAGGTSDLSYINNTYIALGFNDSGEWLTSPDGETWTKRNFNIPNHNWYSLGSFKGKLYCAGSGNGKPEILVTTDGLTWTRLLNGSLTLSTGTLLNVGAASNTRMILTPNADGDPLYYTDDGTTFQALTTTPAGLKITDAKVIYGNGVWLLISGSATTPNSQYYRSTDDGATWTTLNLSTSITTSTGGSYGNDKFVIFLTASSYAISDDLGLTWTARSFPCNFNALRSIDFANGLYVLTTAGSNTPGFADSQVMTSANLIDWKKINPSTLINADARKVMYAAGKFIVAWGVGSTYGGVLYSDVPVDCKRLTIAGTYTDGFRESYSVVSDPTGGGESAVLEIDDTAMRVSDDGTWENGQYVVGPFKLVDNARKYLAFTGTGAVTGLLDTPQAPAYVTTEENPTLTLTFPSTFPSGLTPDEELGEGVTLTVEVTAENAAGTDGPVSDTVQPSLDIIQFNEPLESSDITDGAWISAKAAEITSWQGLTYGSGLFVAVGQTGTNRVMYSTDGIDWNTESPAEDGNWVSVTYGETSTATTDIPTGTGLFVAVSNDATNRVMYSTDAKSWAPASAPVVPGAIPSWSAVTYGNGKFVAVAQSGANQVMYSTDGINWASGSGAAVEATDSMWTSVTYGETSTNTPGILAGTGLFVAVARGGTNRVMYSTDGINWTAASATEANGWFSITCGNGKFVAVAYSGDNQVMYSTDGINWTAALAAAANSWRSVTYGNGKFLAVSLNNDNRVMYSYDAISWTASTAAEANPWYLVTYGNGKFVALSQSGTNQVMWSYTGTGDPETTLTFANGTDMSTLDDNDIVTQPGGLSPIYSATTSPEISNPSNMFSAGDINAKWCDIPNDGVKYTLTTSPIYFEPGARLIIQASGNNVSGGAVYFYLNGNEVLDVTDSANSYPHGIGLSSISGVMNTFEIKVMPAAVKYRIFGLYTNIDPVSGLPDPSKQLVENSPLPDAQGTVGSITGTEVELSTSKNIWRNGPNVTGPDKTPIRSLTADELEAQKLKFLTYNNRKEVVCGEEATAAREALLATLVAAGYTEADINQAYSNLDN